MIVIDMRGKVSTPCLVVEEITVVLSCEGAKATARGIVEAERLTSETIRIEEEDTPTITHRIVEESTEMTLEGEETSGIAGETTFEEETATTSSGATSETT